MSKLIKQLGPFKNLNFWLPTGKTFESIKVSGVKRIEACKKYVFIYAYRIPEPEIWKKQPFYFWYFLFQFQMKPNTTE